MDVQVRDIQGKLIWSRNSVGGVTSASYTKDSTLELIRDALELALYQCKGELSVSDDIDRVADVCAAST